MARDDIFYVDIAFDQYSTKPGDRFKKASEHFRSNQKFVGLKIDQQGYIVDDTRGKQNFAELKAALLGPVKEGKVYAAKHLDDGLLRFLDGQLIAGDRVCYQTFARSGNTFLRNYLELITNVPTGSEMDLSTPMPLTLLGQIGEAIADDRTWVIKSHHPMRMNSLDFEANRIIVLVRNPFDVLISLTTFFTVFSHSKQIENKYEVESPQFFKEFVTWAVQKIKDF